MVAVRDGRPKLQKLFDRLVTEPAAMLPRPASELCGFARGYHVTTRHGSIR